MLATGGDDRRVNLWSLGKPNNVLSISGITSPVQSVAFNSSENWIGAGSKSGVIKVFDLEEKKSKSFFLLLPVCTMLQLHVLAVYMYYSYKHIYIPSKAIACTPYVLVFVYIVVRVHIHTYKTQNFVCLSLAPILYIYVLCHYNIIMLACTMFITMVSILTLFFWPLAVRTISGHKAAISSLDFHRYGDILATGSMDTNLKVSH